MSEFAVGEVAFVVPFQLGPIDLPGFWCTEVTIVSPLQEHRCACGGWVYEVRCRDGTEAYATPRILQKRIPPQQLIEHDSHSETVG